MMKENMEEMSAQSLQDKIFKNMTASEKIKVASSFIVLGMKLNRLNDKKINGGNRTSRKSIKHTK